VSEDYLFLGAPWYQSQAFRLMLLPDPCRWRTKEDIFLQHPLMIVARDTRVLGLDKGYMPGMTR